MIPVTLLVVNARPWSPEPLPPRSDAVAIGADGSVAAVGPARDLEGLRGTATRVLDARGATVTPGLCDAHLHLLAWARAAAELALDPAWSRERVVEAVRAFAAAHPEAPVLVGRGWADDRWPEAPHHALLDAVAPDRPVVLHRRDYHAVWANRRALERAGLGDATPDPAGGRFGRDATGRLTGLAMEHAVRPLQAIVPAATPGRDALALRAAIARLHAEGFTAVHDFEGEEERVRIREAVAEGGAPLRVLAHLAHAELGSALAAGVRSGTGDDGFRLGALKLFADGTLGSRTAALLDPYDGTGGSGMDLMPPGELRAVVARAVAGGLSVAIHAIGDRAVRHALDAFEAAPAAARARLAFPPRIEHAQLVHGDDLPRFAALGVAASMQPSHAVADIPLARERWSARLERAYPWRALLDAGARLAFGSDAPVEPPRAAYGMFCAIARREPGQPVTAAMSPRQCVTLDEALRAYTSEPARLDGRWPRGGTLRAGAHGDLVVWDRDLFACGPDALALARPVATLVAGEVVHGVERADRAEAAR